MAKKSKKVAKKKYVHKKRVFKKKRNPRARPPDPRSVGLIDAIGECMGSCEDLGQEMRDWADNMPENKQGGDKHGEVEAAADTLEEAVQDDPSDPKDVWLNDIKITIQDPTPRRAAYSRSARLGQTILVMNLIIDALAKYDDDTIPEDRMTIAAQYKDKLTEITDNLDGVEFPGMFG